MHHVRRIKKQSMTAEERDVATRRHHYAARLLRHTTTYLINVGTHYVIIIK